MADALTPKETSSDYKAMKSYWDLVDTILAGADAMRAAQQTYLPKFPNESQPDYDYRCKNAKFSNIYGDIVEGLAARPFRDEIGVAEDASDTIKTLIEDIDGRGNHLHVFAASMFYDGINNAIDWLLVDYTKAAPGRTIAEEKASGARPYWVHITAKHMLAAYSGVVNGTEIFVHCRIHEPVTVRDGFGEKTIDRVRIFNREPILNPLNTEEVIGYKAATWELWQEDTLDLRANKSSWTKVDGGPVTIGIIPIAPFITGRRKRGWQIIPPMKAAADLQIEHYQQETALKSIKELTAFPMLAGNGVTPALDGGGNPVPVPVGPRAVLYAPMSQGDSANHGEWTFIEPSAEALTFLSSEVDKTEKQLRELGRQPLTAQSGNITVVVAAMGADKAISACEAWGLNLKDTLENGLKFTAMWLKETTEAEVKINLDNLTMDLEGDTAFADVIAMRAAGDLSQETLWEEGKRRGRLSAEFDADKEKELLLAEMPEDDSQEEIDAATGLPINKPAPVPAAA